MEKLIEQELALASMENGYMIMTGRVDFQKELKKYFKKGEFYPISFDPDDGITDEIVVSHIKHFVYYEEYEKCEELNKLLSDEARSIEI